MMERTRSSVGQSSRFQSELSGVRLLPRPYRGAPSQAKGSRLKTCRGEPLRAFESPPRYSRFADPAVLRENQSSQSNHFSQSGVMNPMERGRIARLHSAGPITRRSTVRVRLPLFGGRVSAWP